MQERLLLKFQVSVPERWTKKTEKREKKRSRDKRKRQEGRWSARGVKPSLTLPLTTQIQHMDFTSDLICRAGCELRTSANWMRWLLTAAAWRTTCASIKQTKPPEWLREWKTDWHSVISSMCFQHPGSWLNMQEKPFLQATISAVLTKVWVVQRFVYFHGSGCDCLQTPRPRRGYLPQPINKHLLITMQNE